MARDNANDILNMISALQRLEMGDLDRLVRIRNRLLDNDIRQDDIDYVNNAFEEIHSMSRQEGAQPKAGSSRMWYLLPLFLSIVGGVVAYLLLRHKDARLARRTLLLGSLLFALFVVLLAVGATSDNDSTTGDITEEITDEITDSTSSVLTDPVPVAGELTGAAPPENAFVDAVTDSPPANNDPEPALGAKQLGQTTHLVSYDEIPDYADSTLVASALGQALDAWDSSNPSLGFELVDSDADLRIKWAQWMPSGGLGLHTVFNAKSAGTDSHIITIRLGNNDCHSNYQTYSTESLKHTIAHELGHYLGLRHIDSQGHLMYSGEVFDVDAASIYDSQGYVIPAIKRPTHNTQYGSDLLLQMESAQNELRDLVHEREKLKASSSDQSLLFSNTKRHNELVQVLESLDDELKCAELAGSLLAKFK